MADPVAPLEDAEEVRARVVAAGLALAGLAVRLETLHHAAAKEDSS